MLSPSTQTTPRTQAKAPAERFTSVGPALRRLGKRVLFFLLIGTTIFWIIHRSSERLDRNRHPAGFTRGLLHGALMPMALPNLLLGQEVNIYAPNNNGRLYKLGYTMGVNGCGALFFGVGFWRLTRWRNGKRQNE